MFVHLWAIGLGVFASAMPLVVHWLTRPRPVRFPLSTLRFVREVVRQRRARNRLRDFVILLLRTVAVLLLAAAMARPLLKTHESLIADDAASTTRVVILDASQSMAAVTRGIRVFERARPQAAAYLEYRVGLRANLIVAGARPRPVFQRPSTNFTALKQELAQATVQPERMDVQSAFNCAADMLSGDDTNAGIRRELIVVSDFQRTNWATADFSMFPGDTVIQLESVAAPSAPSNLGVLRVASRQRAQLGRDVRLEIDVGNDSATPRRVSVQVAAGTTVVSLTDTCAPRSKTTLSTDLRLNQTGWQSVQVRLSGVEDALSADDRRACVLEVRPSPVYALVTRQSEQARPSSSYYVERALAPVEPSEGRGVARVVRVDSADPDRETLGLADAIVLDHPGRLSVETIRHLASLFRRGRGVLYVAAEPIDATNLKRLTDAIGAGLELPVAFAPPPVGQSRRNLFLTKIRGNDPPFDVFGDKAASLFSPLRFAGGLTSRRLESGLDDDILATFSDRSAFLVATSTDVGVLAVLNADLERSDLPASPVFVPLLGELLQHRLQGGMRRENTFLCGEPLAVYLPGDVERVDDLELVGPEPGQEVPGTLSRDSLGIMWHADAAGPPGVYQVKQRGSESRNPSILPANDSRRATNRELVEQGGRTVFAAATAVPAEESDLRSLPANVFQERLAAGRALQFRSAARTSGGLKDDLWAWLAVACATCLLSEIIALRAFRT